MTTSPYRPSKALFTVTDPQGVMVTLERNCWYGHILRGHPELRRRLKDVEKALLKPTEIHENLEQRRMNLVYYYRCPGRDRYQNYLKVAVWVYDPERKQAIVTTAHPIIAIPEPTRWYEGKTRWPTSP